MLFPVLLAACAPPPAAPVEPPAPIAAAPPEPTAPPITPDAAPPTPPPPEPACAADADCGFDPARDLCVADPRANRQPPIVDQGVVCYCESARCASLRVPPVPCESDASCAVRADPRPHPVRADAAHPHERGRPRCDGGAPETAARDFVFSTTCERTNICTMHRHRCRRP